MAINDERLDYYWTYLLVLGKSEPLLWAVFVNHPVAILGVENLRTKSATQIGEVLFEGGKIFVALAPRYSVDTSGNQTERRGKESMSDKQVYCISDSTGDALLISQIHELVSCDLSHCLGCLFVMS